MAARPRPIKVNELTPDPAVSFDPKVVKDYVTYAHRIAKRGLVNSSVGGMVIRVPHPDHPDGVCYAKPQGISLEEVEDGDLVITDIPFGRILAGERATTVGHQMNREILRLRPDINCGDPPAPRRDDRLHGGGLRQDPLVQPDLRLPDAEACPLPAGERQRRGGCRADQDASSRTPTASS